VKDADNSILARSPAVKQGRPPGDEEILAKAYDLRSRFGWDGYAIASRMRFEPGFENVATTDVRRVIKGKFPRGPRRKPETER
jgi:hypothetical protein